MRVAQHHLMPRGVCMLVPASSPVRYRLMQLGRSRSAYQNAEHVFIGIVGQIIPCFCHACHRAVVAYSDIVERCHLLMGDVLPQVLPAMFRGYFTYYTVYSKQCL